jgi:hypothetical protein
MDITVTASVHEVKGIIQAQISTCRINIDREGDGFEFSKSLREVNPESVARPHRLPTF